MQLIWQPLNYILILAQVLLFTNTYTSFYCFLNMFLSVLCSFDSQIGQSFSFNFFNVQSAVTWLCFTPNSEQIITASKDGSIRIWNINGMSMQQAFMCGYMKCFSSIRAMIYISLSISVYLSSFVHHTYDLSFFFFPRQCVYV